MKAALDLSPVHTRMSPRGVLRRPGTAWDQSAVSRCQSPSSFSNLICLEMLDRKSVV